MNALHSALLSFSVDIHPPIHTTHTLCMAHMDTWINGHTHKQHKREHPSLTPIPYVYECSVYPIIWCSSCEVLENFTILWEVECCGMLWDDNNPTQRNGNGTICRSRVWCIKYERIFNCGSSKPIQRNRVGLACSMSSVFEDIALH
jgi:hypothetical protein